MALLEVRHLKKSFPDPQQGRVDVLNIPEFSLEEGRHVGLASPSGTGKTTFLHLIAGILVPDPGSSIRLDGQELVGLSEAERDRVRAAKLGYIFQTFNLLQGFTCLENVLLGMAFAPRSASANRPESNSHSDARERALHLLERVGLADRRDYLPRQLSTGQQQRVAVARALANQPRLVLADEPTGNLDPRNAAMALQLIRETCQESGAALLLVSHDPAILESFELVQSLAELNQAVSQTGPVAKAPAVEPSPSRR